jgi:hypothetical protein
LSVSLILHKLPNCVLISQFWLSCVGSPVSVNNTLLHLHANFPFTVSHYTITIFSTFYLSQDVYTCLGGCDSDWSRFRKTRYTLLILIRSEKAVALRNVQNALSTCFYTNLLNIIKQSTDLSWLIAKDITICCDLIRYKYNFKIEITNMSANVCSKLVDIQALWNMLNYNKTNISLCHSIQYITAN